MLNFVFDFGPFWASCCHPKRPQDRLGPPQEAPRLRQDAPGTPHDAPRPPQDGPKTAPSPPKTPPSGPKKAPRGPKRFHLSPQINVSQLCSMLVIFVIETTFASSQEAINKVQEVSKINISEPPSFRASTPLSLQVPRRDSRSANKVSNASELTVCAWTIDMLALCGPHYFIYFCSANTCQVKRLLIEGAKP